jgi:type IV pilus assembly protein PilQ
MHSTTKTSRHRLRSRKWSPIGVVALPALLLLALDPRPASAGPPQGSPGPSKSSKASKADPKLEVRKSINQIDGLTVEEFADGTTILRVLGHVEPTFNVYRLSDPDRLVVDIAKSERGKAVPHVPVDSWAVGRVSITSVDEHDSKLARVVVNLKRESSYIVVPKGRDLAITITPKEVAPEAYFARKSAGERQAEIETMKTEARKHAEQLEAAAEAKASTAEAKASTAEAKASTAEQRAREAEKRAAEAATRAREAEREAAEIRSEAESIRARAEHEASEREALAAANAEQVEEAAAAKAKQVEGAAAAKAKQVEGAAVAKARQVEGEAATKAKQLELAAAEKARQFESEAAEKARKLAVEAEAKAKAAETKAKKLEGEAAAKARKLADEAEAKAKLAEEKAKLAEEKAKLAEAKAKKLEGEAAAKARLVALEAEEKAKQREGEAIANARKLADEAEEKAKLAEAKAKKLEGEAAVKARQLADEAEEKARLAEAKAKKLEGEAIARAKQLEGAGAAKAKQLEGEAAAKAKHLEAETTRTLDEARRLADARGTALGNAEQAAEEAERKAGHAEQRAAEAKAEAEAAEAYAKRIRKAAEAKAKQADELLASATAAMQQATQEGEQAKHSYDEAKQMLADARKAARKLGKRDAGEKAELQRAVEQAEAATAAAKQRAQEAEQRLSTIERDREALASALAAKQTETEQRSGEEAKKAEQAEAEALAARKRYEALAREKDEENDKESKESKRELREAKSALAKAEAELAKARKDAADNHAKLEALQTQVASAGEQLGETLAAGDERHSLRQQWEDERKAAGHAAVRDVRFEDGPDSARVIVELDGPVVYDASSLTPNMTMLELRDVSIPAGLERSLDTTGFHGPIDRITSFREGDDVKIVVASTMGEPAGIELDRKANRLIWKFPKQVGGDAPAAEHFGAAPPAEHFAAPPQVATDTTPERTEVVSLGGNKVSGFSTPPVLAARPGTKVGNRTRWRGERIDIELQDAPIKDVLLLFSDIGRVNIIAGPEVEGSVTMKLSAVPWDQALDIILRSLQLGMIQEGNVVRVSTQSALEEERRKAIEEANAAVQLKPLETRLIPLSYATVQDMLPKVQSVLSSRGSVTPDSRTNTLIVMDVAENIALAESLVGQLDSQTPQVLIEARIVEARTNWLRQLGIQWGFDFIASPGTGNPTGLLFPNSIGVGGGSGSNQSPRRGLILPGAAANPNYAVDLPAPVSTGSGGAIGFSFGSLSGNLNTNLRLSAAEEEGEVRIISAPKIVTLDNTEAQIEQGVQIPISQVSAQGVNTRYVNATLGLRVTPHVTNEGSVLLEVQVQKNEADFVNTGARGDPTILTKSAQSQLLIIDGDTAVIGGIYTRNQAVNYSQVPWFADIPIIGWFFKNKVERDDRSEMLIFLTPRIVNRSTSIGG